MHLARGCDLAAVYPLQPAGELRDPVPYWSRLGFRPVRDDVLIIDLALVTLGEAVRQLLREASEA